VGNLQLNTSRHLTFVPSVFQHAYGAKTLREKLGKCTFHISPGAFFQVNTETAEVLYNVVVNKVKEVTKDSKPESTLCFDVCCGTGTIGYVTEPIGNEHLIYMSTIVTGWLQDFSVLIKQLFFAWSCFSG
jgi:hypothetical protein